MMNASLNSYVVAYRYAGPDTVPWHAYRKLIPLGIATQIAGELVADEQTSDRPLIVRVSVFDLETWNYGKVKGDPVWNWPPD